ncbi:MAG: AraC family transcriptional regulator [Nocardioides sp.]|nr:AraC family transcriptional regulator [Nocardioides sp.]
MDPLAGFLDGPRARSAFVMRIVLEPPWSMRIDDEAPLSVVAITHGSQWLLPAPSWGGPQEPLELRAGDVLIIRASEPYVVADQPATEPSIVIDPGGQCRTLDGRSLVQSMELGVRTWGNAATGSDVMLVGTYQSEGEVSRRLLDSLPPLVVLRAADWDSPLVGLLASEIDKEEPGQQVVLDRLLDLLLVSALRAAFAAEKVAVPAWFRADADPTVGRVVRMMHDAPGHPWTVAELAAAVGVSRASLARRFHEVVGEPPMTFLTGWRMALAADLLLADGATVTAVARATGYGSPFTFSTAFKRTFGSSPRAYRDQARAETGAVAVVR